MKSGNAKKIIITIVCILITCGIVFYFMYGRIDKSVDNEANNEIVEDNIDDSDSIILDTSDGFISVEDGVSYTEVNAAQNFGGNGILYILQNPSDGSYWFVIGINSDGTVTAIDVAEYCDNTGISESLVQKSLETNTFYDTFGYGYDGAYDNGESTVDVTDIDESNAMTGLENSDNVQ